MQLTKPQQRLIETMRQTGQVAHLMHGGGWRLFDGTPVHYRTVESLAGKGLLEPAGSDLLGDGIACYRLNEQDNTH